MRAIIPWSPDELRAAMTLGNSQDRVWKKQIPRWTGVAAVLGGLLCGLAVFLHSLEPAGCIGLQCETREMRSATGIVPLISPVATILILIGIAGLTWVARQISRFKKLADGGVMCAFAGLAVLFLGGLIQAIFFNGDFPWMPFFVIPGLLAVITGFVLIGVFILRSGVLPRWLGIFLLVSSVLLLAANEQTAAVLLAIPFALAVATVGVFMWTIAERPYTATVAAG
ncbi:hypothetical protein [Arthrobacter sp. R4-81]